MGGRWRKERKGRKSWEVANAETAEKWPLHLLVHLIREQICVYGFYPSRLGTFSACTSHHISHLTHTAYLSLVANAQARTQRSASSFNKSKQIYQLHLYLCFLPRNLSRCRWVIPFNKRPFVASTTITGLEVSPAAGIAAIALRFEIFESQSQSCCFRRARWHDTPPLRCGLIAM